MSCPLRLSWGSQVYLFKLSHLNSRNNPFKQTCTFGITKPKSGFVTQSNTVVDINQMSVLRVNNMIARRYMK